MKPSNGTHFDIRFDEGGFGGFPTEEKAIAFLRKNPGAYTNLRLLQVTHYDGRTRAKEVLFTL